MALTDVEQPASATADEPGAAPAAEPVAADPRRAPLSRAQRRWLLGIVLVAAALRIWWFAVTKTGAPTAWYQQGDQFGYWYYGNEIANGRGYISYLTGEATAYYPVGYPALLALLYKATGWITPDQNLSTGWFHIVLSVTSVAAVFVIGRRMLGATGGLVAAGVLALWPNIIYQVSSFQLETAFIFLTVAALAVIVDHDWSIGPPSRNRLLVFGVLVAVGAMVRPFGVFIMVGLVVALASTGIGWARTLKLLAWPVLVLLLFFVPWTIRNAVRMDTFAPSSTNMGDGLCLDRYDEATGGFRWADHEGCADPDLGEAERNRRSTQLALEWIVENPDRELVQWGRRLRIMFESDNDAVGAVMGLAPPDQQFDPDARRQLEDLADAFFSAVLWLSVPGIVLAARRAPRAVRWLVGANFLGLLMVPLMLYGNPRFHVPLAPFGALGVAGTVVTVAGFVSSLAGRRRGDAPAEPLAASSA